MTETSFKSILNNYFKQFKCYQVSIPASMFSRIGTPDKLLCLRGQFLAIEVKTDTGTVSPMQENAIAEINKAGGVALVLRPKDFLFFKTQFHLLAHYNGILLEMAKKNLRNLK